MGKPTGFLEYPRQGNPAEAPKERVRHFCEFHPGLGREERRRQGARCMECGVPFCLSLIHILCKRISSSWIRWASMSPPTISRAR